MSAPDYKSLYEFEKLISACLESLFTNELLTVIGVEQAATDIEKPRPRVEVFMQPGPRFDNHYVLDAQQCRRENGWSGVLSFTVITSPEYDVHSESLAVVRELASRLDQLDLSDAGVAALNATIPQADLKIVALSYHEITQVKTAGTNSTIEPQSGEYHSKLSYEFTFAIRADAWPGGLYNGAPGQPFQPLPVIVEDGALEPTVDNTGAYQVYRFIDQGDGSLWCMRIINGQMNLQRQ